MLCRILVTSDRSIWTESQCIQIANGLGQPRPLEGGDAYLIEILKIGCNTKDIFGRECSKVRTFVADSYNVVLGKFLVVLFGSLIDTSLLYCLYNNCPFSR